MFVFLESHLPPARLTKAKRLSLKDRIALIESLVSRSRDTAKKKRAFARFFRRLDPVRELRNHIAHGHMLVRVAKDGKTPIMTLSLPKNVDATYAPETRHLEFAELENTLASLAELIEEFQKLSGL